MSATETLALPRVFVRALARAPIFASASRAARDRLLHVASERRLPRGAALFTAGKSSGGVALVLEGRLSCAVVDVARERWVRRVVEPGQVCGVTSSLDDGPLPCNVTAIAATRVLLIPADDLRRELTADPQLALEAAAYVARELRRVISLCGAIASHTPLQRVARYLLERADDSHFVDVVDTQEQIGAQIGTVREVVGRALRSLESRGLISRRGRRIELLASDALRDVAAWNATDDAVLAAS